MLQKLFCAVLSFYLNSLIESIYCIQHLTCINHHESKYAVASKTPLLGVVPFQNLTIFNLQVKKNPNDRKLHKHQENITVQS